MKQHNQKTKRKRIKRFYVDDMIIAFGFRPSPVCYIITKIEKHAVHLQNLGTGKIRKMGYEFITYYLHSGRYIHVKMINRHDEQTS